MQFERPRDQGEAVKSHRLAFSQDIFDKYANGTPENATVAAITLPYRVKVSIPDLNILKGPGTGYARMGYTGMGVFTIIEEQDGWGRLKSGAGWICLKYAEKVM